MLRQLGLLAATTLLITTTSTTVASAAAPDCPEDWYCFYIRVNYDNPGAQYRAKFQSTRFDNFGRYPAAEGPTGNFQDNVESVVNNTNRKICLYNNQRFVGTVPAQGFPNSRIPNLRAASNIADYWKTVGETDNCPST